MKKSTGYAPYLFAFLITIVTVLMMNSLSKPGGLFRSAVFFLFAVSMWHWIEWLLTRSENKMVQWAYVFLGINIYGGVYIGSDYYYFHSFTTYSGFSPWELGRNIFLMGIVATIFIESGKWAKAREKAKIENLRLQAENIETKFKLLREQVNPEFLFQCLKTLQTMVRFDDPQTEGYLLKLADVYRQTLNKEKNVVSLREELALLQSYMYLMQYGRETAVSFDVNVSDAALDYQLPVFALQLLGDNCIKHNVFSDSRPLHIRVFQKDVHSITITNNYQRRTEPKSFGLDIEHLEMRYAMEGIDNAVLIEKGDTTYATTLKLF